MLLILACVYLCVCMHIHTYKLIVFNFDVKIIHSFKWFSIHHVVNVGEVKINPFQFLLEKSLKLVKNFLQRVLGFNVLLTHANDGIMICDALGVLA